MPEHATHAGCYCRTNQAQRFERYRDWSSRFVMSALSLFCLGEQCQECGSGRSHVEL